MPTDPTYEELKERIKQLEQGGIKYKEMKPEAHNSEEYRFILETAIDAVWVWEKDGRICEINDTACKMSGYTRDELMRMSIKDIEVIESAHEIETRLNKIMQQGIDHFETKHRCKDGTIIDVDVSASLIDKTSGRGVAFVRDITERKRLEEERKAYIRFLENLELVDQAIKKEADVEKMLETVMQTVFQIFQCDRAWLLYPCDPQAPSFRVPVEVNKPEYPGAKEMDLEVAMTPGQRQDMIDALASEVPLMYGPGTGRTLSHGPDGQFSVKTQIFMALYPKVGRPWLFGMHQCSHPYIWTEEEQSLFKEIGRRISDGLSSVLFLHELKESEQRFRFMFEQAAIGVAVCDSQTGSLIRVNQKYAEILGYSVDELRQLSFNDIIHPDDSQKEQKNFQLLLQGKIEEFKLEKRYLRKDGATIWGKVTVSKLWKKGEAANFYIEFLEDITSRKRAEEALQNSEIRYKNIFNNIIDIYIETGMDENIIEVSPSIEKYSGYKRDEVIGKSARSYYADPHKRDELLKQVQLKGFLHDFEVDAIHKEGHRVPLAITSTLLKDDQGKPVKLIGMLRPIGERIKAENEIRKQKHLFETMFDTIPDAVFLTNTRHEIQLVNKSVEPIFGYTPEELSGKSSKMLYADKEALDDSWVDASNKNTKNLDVSFISRYRNKDGRDFSGETFGAKLFDENRQWIGNLGIIRDITEREETELRLQQAQKMESIGNLAGGIAHDFNNILFPIIGISELLLESFSRQSEAFESVQEILKAGLRGSDLVKQILAFSRQAERKLIPVRVQHIIREVLKLIRATIPSYIEIEEDIQPDCGMLMADPTQIHQVAMNILTNAFHALEPEGGTITVALKEIEIVPTIYPPPGIFLDPGKYALLSISDTGHGISADLINKIFDPYFTTKEHGKGTGLGLSVAYGIIKEHRGEIKAYSKVGEGTTFSIYLPLMGKPVESDSAIGTETLVKGDEHILVIDDEQAIAKLEKRILEGLGYTVTIRFDSLEALEAFKVKPDAFDLVITDMAMPNMPGDQLTKEILAIRPDMPIIICTGFSERINKENADRLGIKGFLMKPVVKSELAQMVRKILDETKGQPGS